MEEKFKDLDVAFGSFTLNQVEALNYLDYVARQHLEQILIGEEDNEGTTEYIEDIMEMKRDIVKHDYEFVKFVSSSMSASQLDIIPMIEEQELKEAIEDLTEWVLNNCNTDDMPLIFMRKKHQAMLEQFVKERLQK